MPVIIRSSLLLLVLLTSLAGCITRPAGIADLQLYPQDVMAYLQARDAAVPLIPADLQAQLDARYNERFFAPWQQQRASLPASEAFWGVAVYGGRQGYAENLQPLAKERWQQLVAALQRESYPSLARPAITVRNTACRVFPTIRPFFLDPRQPGEGYPFDYFQNSAVWAGTPLLVTHASLDGAWYFAESGFVAGWLPAHDVAWADAEFRTVYRTGSYAAVLHDQVTLRDDADDYLTQTHIGAVFPVQSQDGDGLRLLVPVRDASGAATARVARADPSAGSAQAAAVAAGSDRRAGEPHARPTLRVGWPV